LHYDKPIIVRETYKKHTKGLMTVLITSTFSSALIYKEVKNNAD